MAIRRELLIHTVIVKGEAGEPDMWGNAPPGIDTTINTVRVEPKTKLVRGGSDTQVDSTTTIFWDATFSTPFTFEQGMEVEFNGKPMHIVAIDTYYDAMRLHHLEIRCI